MMCPLLYLGNISRFSQKTDPADCLQDRCAWWDNYEDRCAILTLAVALWNMHASQREALEARGELPPH